MATPASYATLVQELYVAYFGRPADETGWQNFEAALAAANAPTTLPGLLAAYGTNPAVHALIDAFGNSAESGRLYGTNIASSSAAAQSFVTAVFESLFNRAPLPAGLTFWSNAITSGNLSPGEAALAIASGAGTVDSATVANKLAAAADFTNDLATHGDAGLSAYRGSAAAAEGRTFLAQIGGTTTQAVYDAFAAATTNAIVNGAVPPPISTPTPTPTPSKVMALTVAGDTIHLNNTTAASTLNLTGADLTTFPTVVYGTVAELVTLGINSVTDSGGNFTLNASGNGSATTFDFGSGIVSGADPASSASITYAGVTTYVTSTHGDTVTLSAAAQNVTGGASGNNTINLGALAYTGTLAFGAAGADTIDVTVGGNLSGGTITSGGATVALALSSAGTETLSTAEYNALGSITGGTFGGNTIAFSNAGTVTANANVGNYNLFTGTNSIALNNVADNVTGAASGTDTVNLAALAYTGTLAFGAAGVDTVNVTVGGNISGGAVTSSGATVALVLSAAGTETLNTAEYNLFNATSITGGSFGGDTITLSNAGTVTANANVGNYHLSTAGNTIMLNNVADNVTGAASGNDTVNLAALAYTGTLAFGAGGSATVDVTFGGNLSGATITSGGAGVALVLSAAGSETLSTAEYNLFNATSITGGSFGGDTIILSNAGTVTANANVGNYNLATAGNTITLNNAADNVTGAASGNDTVNLAALTYTGTTAFGAAGSDTVDVSGSSDISGGSITTGGATVALVFNAAGNETVSTVQYNLFNATSITGGSFGGDTVTFSNAGTVTASANVGNYDLSTAGNTITLTNVADNVTGAASGNDTVNLAALTYNGTLAFGAAGADTVDVTVGGNISVGSITTSGATVALVLSAAGNETLSTAEYNLFNATSITGGSFGGDTITLANAGTVTANANVGNYDLSSAGNTITLTNVADNVTGAASGNDTVNLAALAYTGTTAFGAGGSDAIHVTIGGNISGGTITTGGATVALVLSGGGTETMTTAQYNLFNATSITGGSFGGDIITFSNAGTVTANANVGNYNLSTAGNTITLTNVADNVNGAASGNDTVNLAALAYTGTVAFGAAGSDTIDVSGSSNISGGSITTGGATVALVYSAAGAETMTTAEYNLFNATSITGGSFGGDTATFSNAGTVTANANVGNYGLSSAGNTITLTNVADNVNGAASGSDIVNLAALAYTGTLAFGAAGADTVNVTIGGNISGGTISSGGATVALVLSGAGSETLNTAEYNLFNATSITGGSFGGDTITFSNAGTVTANANVGNYNLATAGNTITLTNVADNVTGAASGNDTVNLAALAYTGTTAFGASGSDSIHVTIGGNISGGTITTGGATVALVLSGGGTETMTTAQYNLFNATSITGGSFGGDIITFSNAGTVTANANVGNYDLSTAGNTITLTNVADNVNGAASGNDTVNLAALTYTGTTAFGASGSDAIHVTVGGNISGGTVSTTGATVALVLSGGGTETLNTAEYNLFNATSITGGSFGGDTISFSNAGTVTANANVGNYDLSTSGNTITLTNVADHVIGAASGNDTVNLAALTYTGTTTFGAAGSDSIHVTIGGDISGGTITTGGATVSLVLSGAGTETLSTAEYNLFNATSITGGSFGGDTISFSNTGTVTDNANVGNYNLSSSGNIITLNNAADHVTGATTGSDTYNINNTAFTGTLSLGTSGADALNIDVSSNSNISGGTINSGGTSADLSVSGSGTLTVSSSEAGTFHAASTAIVAGGTVTMNVADASSTIDLNAQENALTTVGLQVANNNVNVSVGAASVNAGAAGFNQTITEHALTGGDTFNIDNGAATITGALDATHYVTINGFNTSSDNLILTLSGANQNGTPQSISDSGNDAITAANNGVIYLTNLGALTGYVVANANDLSSAETNILAAVDPTTASTGVYTFVIDTINGAAIYETHFTGSTLDGIQLVGVAAGVGTFNLVGHIA